jgi:phosphotransferase system HPr (HPr) family protein
MIEKEITVNLEHGLHARPATEFVKTANSFASSVRLEKNGKFVDAKSILGVMSMAIAKGQIVKVIVDGQDERRAIDQLERILAGK